MGDVSHGLKMIDEFYDGKEGGFFITGLSSESLIVRLKNAADEAIPSANAIAIQSLLKLGHLTGNKNYLAKRFSYDRFDYRIMGWCRLA